MGPGNRALDLEWLVDFLALADSGNFSRAAQARSIAQPALSRHIQALEQWVGAPLVDRSAHPVALTEAGKRFQPAVQELLQSLETARDNARSAQHQAQLRLQFAATHVLSLRYFPQWLRAIEAQVALGPIQIVSDNLLACEDLMLQRRIQFLLCHGHAGVTGRLDEAKFQFHAVGDELLLPVCQPLEDGAPAHRIDRAQRPLPVLAYSDASGLGRIMRQLMPAAFDEQAFAAVFTAHHAELLKTMALAGRGIAWLPRSLVEQELQYGRLVAAGNTRWQLPIDIRLYRQRNTLPAAAESFWQVVLAR